MCLGWPQGQFIQQIAPPAPQATIEGYPAQQYPNGIYQTTYQQPGFETNTFYTGAVQVLTNTRPPSASEHVQIPTRTNGSYSHTPSPVPAQAPQQNTQRTNITGQYHQDYVNNQNYAAPATTPTGSVDNSGAMSRPSSVNSQINVPTSNQNYQAAQTNSGFTTVSSANFSPSSNNTQSSNFTNTNITSSGNGKPGYPQVNSHPQLVSHNSSGYPGDQYSGRNDNNTQYMLWEPQQQQQQQQQTQNTESAKTDDSNNRREYEQQQQQHPHETKPPDQTDEQYNRVNINSRIKTMILNKQQSIDNKDAQHDEHKTGHFLWYSHHRHPYILDDGGGLFNNNNINQNNNQNNNQNVYQNDKNHLSNHLHFTTAQENLQSFKSNLEQEHQQEDLQYAVNSNFSKNGWTYSKKSEFQTNKTNLQQNNQQRTYQQQNQQQNQQQIQQQKQPQSNHEIRRNSAGTTKRSETATEHIIIYPVNNTQNYLETLQNNNARNYAENSTNSFSDKLANIIGNSTNVYVERDKWSHIKNSAASLPTNKTSNNPEDNTRRCLPNQNANNLSRNVSTNDGLEIQVKQPTNILMRNQTNNAANNRDIASQCANHNMQHSENQRRYAESNKNTNNSTSQQCQTQIPCNNNIQLENSQRTIFNQNMSNNQSNDRSLSHKEPLECNNRTKARKSLFVHNSKETLTEVTNATNKSQTFTKIPQELYIINTTGLCNKLPDLRFKTPEISNRIPPMELHRKTPDLTQKKQLEMSIKIAETRNITKTPETFIKNNSIETCTKHLRMWNNPQISAEKPEISKNSVLYKPTTYDNVDDMCKSPHGKQTATTPFKPYIFESPNSLHVPYKASPQPYNGNPQLFNQSPQSSSNSSPQSHNGSQRSFDSPSRCYTPQSNATPTMDNFKSPSACNSNNHKLINQNSVPYNNANNPATYNRNLIVFCNSPSPDFHRLQHGSKTPDNSKTTQNLSQSNGTPNERPLELSNNNTPETPSCKNQIDSDRANNTFNNIGVASSSNYVETPKKIRKERKSINKQESDDKMKNNNNNNNVGAEIPKCSCFPPDRIPPPEPGSYYTHLGRGLIVSFKILEIYLGDDLYVCV